jgi:hypothetical protein
VKSRAPNQLGIYDMSGNIDEWAWDTWVLRHDRRAGQTDPTDGLGMLHATRKVRRGGWHQGDNVTRHVAARRIRSINGADPSLGFRIALSADSGTVPSDMVRPCEILLPPPINDGDFVNSHRDTRWVTGDNYVWRGGDVLWYPTIITEVKIWDDGTALIMPPSGIGAAAVSGRWYTTNNVALVVVPASGDTVIIPYIFLSAGLVSTINNKGLDSGLPIGRLERVRDTSPTAKPTVPGAQLTVPQRHRMVDMTNIPTAARGNDSRLFYGPDSAWWRDASAYGGGTHRYRMDVIRPDSMLYVFYEPRVGGMDVNGMARGRWFTVNDMFLRVTRNAANVANYLYTVIERGGRRYLYTISYSDYERGDVRILVLTPNAGIIGLTQPRNPGFDLPVAGFRPPPCPPGGC